MELIQPPHNAQAEQAVLGSLLRNPQSLLFVQEIIGPDDFYLRANRMIFDAITELGPETDVVTVAERLEAKGQLDDVGGMPVFQDIAENSPFTSNVGRYARVVANHASARRMIGLSAKLHEASADDWQAKADEVMRELLALGGVERRHDHALPDALKAAVDVIEAANLRNGLVGVPTGIKSLDKQLGGYHDTDLIVIGARPAMGKTAFALNSALAADRPVGMISAEQPADQIGMRLMAIEGRINAGKMRNADLDDAGWSRVTSAMAKLKERKIYINDRPSISIAQVHRQARAWKQQHDIGILFVDYLQRIRATNPKASKTEQIGEIARGLKDIGRELKIPVVTLAQVNRSVESKNDRRPSMGDLYHSSEIEMEADVVMLLYRDEVYNQDTDKPGVAEIIVDKNRHGAIGKVMTAWLGECMRFEDLAHEYQHAQGF